MVLIGLNGKARSGKDTCADFMQNWCYDRDLHMRRESFAWSIKALTSSLFNVPFDLVNDGPERERKLPGFDFSLREFMQTFGTDCARKLDPDIWVKLLNMRLYRDLHEPLFKTPGVVVITDVRFDNEAEWVKGKNGFLFQVLRPDVESINSHSSENGIDEGFIDDVILNDGSLEELEEEVERFMEYVAGDLVD